MLMPEYKCDWFKDPFFESAGYAWAKMSMLLPECFLMLA